MKDSIKLKLDIMLERHEEISRLLTDSAIIHHQNNFKSLSKEYAYLAELVAAYQAVLDEETSIKNLESLMNGDDAELAELAKEELLIHKTQLVEREENLLWQMIPKDPDDECSVYLEIRAGTGGEEAALFAGDLFRMYARYAESKSWPVEIISAHPSDHGGFKEIIAKLSGTNVYAELKFESGVHRVQRVPETEAQGRVHTSACTVAILPELTEIEELPINPEDLRIDTYRASGAGGQHVNKTDSAIRITHLPSGLVIECQDERSQHKNKARALALLKTKLLTAQRSKQIQEQALHRKLQIGSGDRSERIRTYNFPQGRLTDHRINLTLYQLSEIMTGDLNPVINALKQEHHAELLAELGRNDSH